eukprot:3025591-Pyramimonas_sp.AAC.2
MCRSASQTTLTERLVSIRCNRPMSEQVSTGSWVRGRWPLRRSGGGKLVVAAGRGTPQEVSPSD